MAELSDVPVALQGLLDALDGEAHPLADPYMEAVLAAAQSAAGGHPTPQARMAASGLRADRGTLLAPAGALVTDSSGHAAPLGSIIAGAEWGSSTYTQFAGRNTRGYWLFPSFEAEPAITAGEKALQDVVSKVVR
jgi:hypothetical protein